MADPQGLTTRAEGAGHREELRPLRKIYNSPNEREPFLKGNTMTIIYMLIVMAIFVAIGAACNVIGETITK